MREGLRQAEAGGARPRGSARTRSTEPARGVDDGGDDAQGAGGRVAGYKGRSS